MRLTIGTSSSRSSPAQAEFGIVRARRLRDIIHTHLETIRQRYGKFHQNIPWPLATACAPAFATPPPLPPPPVLTNAPVHKARRGRNAVSSEALFRHTLDPHPSLPQKATLPSHCRPT